MKIFSSPKDASETRDSDNDGYGDNADMDADNDGLIEIESLTDLDEIRNHLNGEALYSDATGCFNDTCLGFELTTDLDFDTDGNGSLDAGDDYWNGGLAWEPLGGSIEQFTARFDGNGHTISNLYINRDDRAGAGLFGATLGAHIGNVNLDGDLMSITCYYGCGGLIGGAFESTEVTQSSSTGSVHSIGEGRLGMTGGLVGYLNKSSIKNSYATGDASSDSGAYVGGLVGYLIESASVESSYAMGNATTNRADDNGFTGGLAGYIDDNSAVINSFATGDVISDGWNNGGLIGMANGTITASFASGSVTSGKNAGGLVGFARNATISASYATGALSGPKVGGLIGGNDRSTYNSNYWSTDTTGSSRSGGTRYSSNYFGDVEANLACPTAANDSTCSPKGTLYVDWETYKDSEDHAYWDFGTSSELPGLTIGGNTYRPNLTPAE